MSFIPPGETIVGKKKCRISGQEFFVTDKDLEFYDKVSPVFAGKKYSIGSPSLSPDERQKRRLTFRNERKLYHRKCDKTGNQIISMYSAEKPYMIYDQKVWWGDEWSAFDYAKGFDFERSFFEQFQELMLAVPRINLINKDHENSEFCNFATNNQNSYLLFTSGWCEDSYYSNRALKNRNVCDCSNITHSEICYEVLDSTECYNCQWLQNCYQCSDCIYGYNLKGCKNCIGCYGLTNKHYCIGNKQFNQNTYQTKSKEIIESFSRNKFQKHLKDCVRKFATTVNVENCTGDNLSNSKNSQQCFESESLDNCRYIFNATELKDSYDINNDDHSELGYEVVGGESNYLQCFCDISWFNRSVFYSSLCFHSQDIFGCSGIRKGFHCIFNTTYSTQEYGELCGKIIDHMKNTGEWGEFFPHELSPFGYNETVAQEYFPITEDEARQRGWNWKRNEEISSYHGPYYEPLNIDQYDEKIVEYATAQKNIDGLLEGIIKCEITSKPFKVIKQELVFYIENHILIPRKHPDQRHKERLEQRNPRTIYERTCAECSVNIMTTYAPERPERVLCESCYQKLVY